MVMVDQLKLLWPVLCQCDLIPIRAHCEALGVAILSQCAGLDWAGQDRAGQEAGSDYRILKKASRLVLQQQGKGTDSNIVAFRLLKTVIDA